MSGAKTLTALVITSAGIVSEVELPATDWLDPMQKLVGGYVEPVKLPHAVVEADVVVERGSAVAYVDEDGKVRGRQPNLLASLLLVQPIVGDVVVAGLSPAGDAHVELPASVIALVSLIERRVGELR